MSWIGLVSGRLASPCDSAVSATAFATVAATIRRSRMVGSSDAPGWCSLTSPANA